MIPRFSTLIRHNWPSIWGLHLLSFIVTSGLSIGAALLAYLIFIPFVIVIGLVGVSSGVSSDFGEALNQFPTEYGVAFSTIMITLIILLQALAQAIPYSYYYSGLFGVFKEMIARQAPNTNTLMTSGFSRFVKSSLLYFTIFLILSIPFLCLVIIIQLDQAEVLSFSWILFLVMITILLFIFTALSLMHAPIIFTLEQRSIADSILSSVRVTFTSLGKVILSALTYIGINFIIVLFLGLGILFIPLMIVAKGIAPVQVLIGILLFFYGLFFVFFLIPFIHAVSLKSIVYRYYKHIRPPCYPHDPSNISSSAIVESKLANSIPSDDKNEGNIIIKWH
ncbi:hypothetical protein [Mechercharimyces sp. CAU 1602]|uniref:hypothetical protein n=1 Tax=Mechercharimyces sp. CAU 1602 TaxID=2973933 RepID=UPI0021633EAD|nr:hypothetical protein [Mechercharimyces sp. CAU 1602]MCS1351538.1 hypothetical protein [Mechercharimyces sp. CAU 1602]